VQSQARNEEAEQLWKKVIAIQRNENSRPYPLAMENLADLYHNLGKFKQEEVIRQEILFDLRLENNNNYNYQIKEQLQQLASCLAHMHREEESKALLAEAQKLKT
jgi:hypothetical protein